MGDVVLADPQGKQLLFAGVRLNQAFNYALDMETFEYGVAPRPVKFPRRNHIPTVTIHDVSKVVDTWMAERHVHAFNDNFGINSCTTSSWPRQNRRRDVVPRQVNFPRHEQRDEDLRLGNANWWGQTPGRCISQDEQLACIAAVAESKSQTLGVAVNSVTLHLPLIKHPSYNQSAMASGCYPQDALIEASAGTNLMVAPKVAYSIMYCRI